MLTTVRQMHADDEVTIDHTKAFVRCGCGMCPASVCDACGKQAKPKICSQCGTGFYCSRECQNDAWPGHLSGCKARRLHLM
jgi:hypothetical protein